MQDSGCGMSRNRRDGGGKEVKVKKKERRKGLIVYRRAAGGPQSPFIGLFSLKITFR